ncbi:hypothetical protein ABEB36_001724 [Hypothenemus hampei]|uniref:Uncharacterized protein n=1 Tax=Hypothenemus hampei TaxID=57062 RepID=A0ABD1FFH3_HYPHA
MAAAESLMQNTKFEELCRLCGSKTDMLAVHIFNEEGTFSELGKKIYSCLQLEIHQQDELPKLLCENCLVKLELFWDFKDRSFRTEQLLIQLHKQLKSNGSNQLVPLDANGMIMQVLSSEIDIPQLDRRDNQTDYSVVLPHLNGLELNSHHHHIQTVENGQRYANDTMNLMQHDLLNGAPQNLHVSMGSSDSFIKTDAQANGLESLGYPEQQNSLAIDSNLSDNSLGVDTHFNGIMQSDSVYAGNLEQDPDLSNFSLVNNCQGHYFKYEQSDLSFNDKESSFKEEISLDSLDGFRNDDSNSLPNLPSSPGPQNELSNESVKSTTSSLASKPQGKICTVCGKTYKTNYKLAEHMTKHTGERPYKCKSCDKSFRSKIGLAQHEAKHTGQYELRCSTCGKGFQCRSYLMVHQKVHSDLKPYPCTTCGINFKTKQSLLDHTNRHLGVKPFSCSICNRGFITKSLCLAHEKTHAGVDNRKYSCKICQKRFVSKSYLQTHSRIHTGEKSFICEVCGKGFLTMVDLKIHLTMHTGEKSYVCEMCGKAFARRDALKCHRRMHTGERPYRCDICGRTFTQFTPMANHKKHHTGEKPFCCETCGKKFVSKSSLATHQKKHVRAEKDPESQKNDKDLVKIEDTIN